MIIAGWQKTSVVDYPGRLCSTVFLGGCNFRCPFCHNGILVTDSRGEAIPLEWVVEHLTRWRHLLQALTISGGEPTLQPDLLARLVRAAKDLGYQVKLDTNGSRPEVVQGLLDLLDYVALDVKHQPEGYAGAAGVPVDLRAVERTVQIIAGRPHELRTTLVPGLHTPQDIELIGRWLGSAASSGTGAAGYALIARTYVLQPFRAGPGVLDAVYRGLRSFTPEEIQRFRFAAEKYFARVLVRGMYKEG
ncbi:MAG: anaerobic ribonucleoside-triphosphate reductase activating protein [Bacillota bacterium]